MSAGLSTDKAGSDTPRTDALLLEINEGRVYENDSPVADLARQLERELRAMTDYAELASDVIKRAKIMGERP
jgi:hypothetical protein